ncbi:hypothetical protein KDH_09100 [Dictyobacter sp. S3.2.2.5]|uniref:Uncharacterized protein n=1 Tax=Dictyobacter halimunensis TaxID=3026934 RepID=A0ABQ6FMN1_9CHLR|nr:hypothetical protein KDH_09100 [Dictyobacter sp. S3.2.2.5]
MEHASITGKSPHKRKSIWSYGTRLFAVGSLAILLALVIAPGAALADTITNVNGTINFGKYFIQNNEWGNQYNGWGSGYQSISHDSSQNSTGAWSASFNWSNVLSDDAWHIKAWPSIVDGWQWGTWSNNTDLPVKLWDNKDITTSWHFSPNGGSSYRADVAYDLWIHNLDVDSYWPTDEVMIWPWYTDEDTGARSGTYVGTLYANGANWDLYKSWNASSQSPYGGWTFWKFIRQDKTTQLDNLNIKDFMMYLQWSLPNASDRISNALSLTSIQAGSEIWYGNGTFSTDYYSVNIS